MAAFILSTWFFILMILFHFGASPYPHLTNEETEAQKIKYHAPNHTASE